MYAIIIVSTKITPLCVTIYGRRFVTSWQINRVYSFVLPSK